jgi:cephalosporin hydroxylase
MSKYEEFKKECATEIAEQGNNEKAKKLTNEWMTEVSKSKYCYHFEWLGRPIIQYPQDIVAMQELIFKVQPDLIIETGIAHGGSIIYYSSLLELNAIMGGPKDANVVAGVGC